jgi:hypothetical protein
MVRDAKVAYCWLKVPIKPEASLRFRFRTNDDGGQADHVLVAISCVERYGRHQKHMANPVHERRRHLLKQGNWDLFERNVTGNFKKDLDSGYLSQDRGNVIHDCKGGADECKLK